MYNYQDDEITELRKEIEQLKTGNRLHLELAEIKEAEIKRLREALKDCSADFVTKSSDHRVAAQEILNEFERRALLARAALKEKE